MNTQDHSLVTALVSAPQFAAATQAAKEPLHHTILHCMDDIGESVIEMELGLDGVYHIAQPKQLPADVIRVTEAYQRY